MINLHLKTSNGWKSLVTTGGVNFNIKYSKLTPAPVLEINFKVLDTVKGLDAGGIYTLRTFSSGGVGDRYFKAKALIVQEYFPTDRGDIYSTDYTLSLGEIPDILEFIGNLNES